MGDGPRAVAAFILFVGVLIFVHELGHFLAAKYFGIKVLKFSLGFGRPIIQFTRGETTYQVALLPLGGFVKMLGHDPSEPIKDEERHRAFSTAPPYQRALIALSGPVFNLVFPVVCYFSFFLLGPEVDAPVIGHVDSGGAAHRAGLRAGDRVIEIEGMRVYSFSQIPRLLNPRAGATTKVRVEREGKTVDFDVTPKPAESRDEFGDRMRRGLIGVTRAQFTHVGVESDIGRGLGFQTGDAVMRVGDASVRGLFDLNKEIQRRRGQSVDIALVRTDPLLAGDVLWGRRARPMVVRVAIPDNATGIHSLGLGPASGFVRALEPEGAAARAGLRPGDRILRVNGDETEFLDSLLSAVERAGEREVRVAVLRDGVVHELSVKSDWVKIENPSTGTVQSIPDVGLGLGDPNHRLLATVSWLAHAEGIVEVARLSVVEAFEASVAKTVETIVQTVVAIGKVLTNAISSKMVGGVILFFQVAASAAEGGILVYLDRLALISINLGLVNLLPVPILDGGHLMFCAIEGIKRRPVSFRTREIATIVGLVLLVGLFILGFSNDIRRLLNP